MPARCNKIRRRAHSTKKRIAVEIKEDMNSQIYQGYMSPKKITYFTHWMIRSEQKDILVNTFDNFTYNHVNLKR